MKKNKKQNYKLNRWAFFRKHIRKKEVKKTSRKIKNDIDGRVMLSPSRWFLFLFRSIFHRCVKWLLLRSPHKLTSIWSQIPNIIKYALRCAVVENKHTQRDGVEWNNKANAKKAKTNGKWIWTSANSQEMTGSMGYQSFPCEWNTRILLLSH